MGTIDEQPLTLDYANPQRDPASRAPTRIWIAAGIVWATCAGLLGLIVMAANRAPFDAIYVLAIVPLSIAFLEARAVLARSSGANAVIAIPALTVAPVFVPSAIVASIHDRSIVWLLVGAVGLVFAFVGYVHSQWADELASAKAARPRTRRSSSDRMGGA